LRDFRRWPKTGRRKSAKKFSSSLEDLIDHQFVADCARDNVLDIPTIEEVRQDLAKIPGSLAQDIIA
jgi:hypothetical protein